MGVEEFDENSNYLFCTLSPFMNINATLYVHKKNVAIYTWLWEWGIFPFFPNIYINYGNIY